MSQQIPTVIFDPARVDPIYPECNRLAIPLNLAPNTTFARGQILGIAGAAQDHTFVVSDTPTITAGTFKFSATNPLTGVTAFAEYSDSEDLAYNISNANFQTALEAIYGAGNVAVTGSGLPGNDTTIALQGDLASLPAAVPTIDNTGLTGGTLAVATGDTGRTANTGIVGVNSNALYVLPMACRTDAAGMIAFSDGAGWLGHTQRTVAVWARGDFDAAKLVGLSALNSATQLALGRVISGTVSAGIFRLGT